MSARTVWLASLLSLLVGCAPAAPPPSQVITGDATVPVVWSDEERAKDIAMRTLRVGTGASHHLVRLRGSERPHYHDETDLTAFVIEGRVEAHVGTRVVETVAGDVVDIPRGTLHWMKNVHATPSVAYVVFSPAFDGTDRRFVDAR